MRFTTYDAILISFEIPLYIFHITFTIFLFMDKSKKFNEAFFNIIRTIFIADLLFLFISVVTRFPRFGFWPQFYQTNGWFAAVSFFSVNYLAFFQFICHTFLALNRFTALWFPLKHARIWEYQWYTFLIIILSFIPVASQLPTNGIYLYSPDGSVASSLFPDSALQRSFLITNGVFCSTTVLGLVINILAVFKFYLIKKAKILNETNNKEGHLFYISCILFIYQCFRCGYNYSKYVYLENKEVSKILGDLLPFFADAYAGIGCFSLLFMSLSTRRGYVKFWTFNKIILKGTKISTTQQQTRNNNNVTRIK